VDEVQSRPGGNRIFDHSETILPVPVRLIPFFTLSFQVFSMILSTFFYCAIVMAKGRQYRPAIRPLFYRTKDLLASLSKILQSLVTVGYSPLSQRMEP
jgi:hypothetical protein